MENIVYLMADKNRKLYEINISKILLRELTFLTHDKWCCIQNSLRIMEQINCNKFGDILLSRLKPSSMINTTFWIHGLHHHAIRMKAWVLDLKKPENQEDVEGMISGV